LEDRGRRWQQHYTRLADDLPPRKIDPAEQPIHDVELWDLVSAFGRVMRENAAVTPPTIIYDDTPIQVYMQRIHERLVASRKAAFSEMFQPGMHKSAMIGVFLAILELVRHHRVYAEQEGVHGEIWVTPGDEFHESLELGEVDSYGR
jgi:segregation and condensation protein A